MFRVSDADNMQREALHRKRHVHRSATHEHDMTTPRRSKGGWLSEGWGERLLQLRVNAGLRQRPPRVISQREVGRATQITGQTIGRYEAEIQQPSFEKLEKICRYLDGNPAWVAYQQGDMFPYPRPGAERSAER